MITWNKIEFTLQLSRVMLESRYKMGPSSYPWPAWSWYDLFIWVMDYPLISWPDGQCEDVICGG